MEVVITDFPERELLDNIQYNVNENIPKHLQQNVIVIVRYFVFLLNIYSTQLSECVEML
jgi:hypothetical protein